MDEHKQTIHQDPLINLLFEEGLQGALPRIAEILTNTGVLIEISETWETGKTYLTPS